VEGGATFTGATPKMRNMPPRSLIGNVEKRHGKSREYIVTDQSTTPAKCLRRLGCKKSKKVTAPRKKRESLRVTPQLACEDGKAGVKKETRNSAAPIPPRRIWDKKERFERNRS